MPENIHSFIHSFFYMSLFAAFSAVSPTFIQAQNADKDKNIDADYKQNDFALGIGMQGRKASFSAHYARAYTPYKSLIFSFDFTEVKADKERRNMTAAFSTPNANSSAYVYGKRNNLYVVRLGVGQKTYISERTATQDISLAFSYQAGLSLGLLKPYYLELIYRTDSTFRTSVEPYSAQNRDIFLSRNSIIGAGGFRFGWNELQVRAGAFVKGALWIEFGADSNLFGALELGGVIDAYPKSMPILAFVDSPPVMFHIYAHAYFGGRW
jgi:hypothetical protein